MAYDDIVKALTIQISADDLTGGAWSNVGKGMKSAWDGITQLNQAWEFGIKVYDKLASSLNTPIAILSEGGAYAEAEAGFKALADSYKVNGDKILSSIREISLGSVGIMEATQAASNAIKKGFSSDQIELMAAFAKKYSDTVGGDFLTILADVEKSIATGNMKAAKSYDLPIEKNMEWIRVQEILEGKLKSMGAGAFNFGDEWAGVTKSIANAYAVVYKELNNLTGAAGFGTIAGEFRKAMTEIEQFAGPIATSIFYPIYDAARAALWPINSIIETIFDGAFSDADMLGVKVLTITKTIGNTFYDTAIFVKETWNIITSPINAFFRQAHAELEWFYGNYIKFGQFLGASQKTIDQLKLAKLEAYELSKIDVLGVDTKSLVDKQIKYNAEVSKTAANFSSLLRAGKEGSEGIKYVGQAVDATANKIDGASKAIGKAAAEWGKLIDLAGETSISGSKVYNMGKEIFVMPSGKDLGELKYTDISSTKQASYIDITNQLPGVTKIGGSGEVISRNTANGLTYGQNWGDGGAGSAAGGGGGGNGTSAQNAVPRTSQQVIKFQVEGKDGAMKELIEEMIERLTTKAVAEGLITAGV